MGRHAENRDARRRQREADLDALDRSDPSDARNTALVEAVQFSQLQRASRPRARARIDFDPRTVLNAMPLWRS